MHTLRLEVEDTIIDKVMLFLQKLPNDKVRIKEEITQPKTDIESSVKQAVKELNMIKKGRLEAQPIEKLLNAL